MRRALLTTFLFASLALAGCLGDDEATSDAPAGTDAGSTQDIDGIFHFAPDGAMETVRHEGDGRTPIGWSWLQWMEGVQAPTWTSPAFEEPTVLTQVNVTITYYAEAAAVFPDTLRPQFTIWFGVGAPDQTPAFFDHGFQPGPLALVAGETYEVTFPVRLALGGLAIDAGQSLVIPVASYYPDGLGAGNVGLVFAGSQVEWQGQTRMADAFGTAATTEHPVSLNGGRCVAPLNPNDSAHARFPFEVDANVTAIDVHLERVMGLGMGPDLDMFLQDGAGDTVVYAAGSGTPERIQVRGVNLAEAAPGTWTLNVYNCQPQASQAVAELTVWTA
ncbi:MAG: hypothetical protein ACPGQL_06130 [Thermoplasmatota archaeon]